MEFNYENNQYSIKTGIIPKESGIFFFKFQFDNKNTNVHDSEFDVNLVDADECKEILHRLRSLRQFQPLHPSKKSIQKGWQYLEKIRNDRNDPEIVKLIQQDLADAKTLNVRKTPGFFVNGKPLPSFGYKQLQELVEFEIKKKY